MSVAIYPGTFDPITFGHIDVAVRASRPFEKLVLLIMNNPLKPSTLFNKEERMQMAQEVFSDYPNIQIDTHSGLMVEYARQNEVHVVVRGLRAVSDFEYEMQMAAANKILFPELDTFFLMTDTRYSFISSSLVKEIALHGGSVDMWVPPSIRERLQRKVSRGAKQPG
ncbi:MAG TPA: pantetheine-phosphate adenylyltransferase [Thermotogota bacterium]|nr:pantetheine-phosphate adenylyltransferase [Thermotogota bacterium]HRW91589.1 pantetheine-phosphate adenylyltransferase [Thermotogota bacterium]